MNLDINIISEKIKAQIAVNFSDKNENQKQAIFDALFLITKALNNHNTYYDYQSLDLSLINFINKIKESSSLIDCLNELTNEINQINSK